MDLEMVLNELSLTPAPDIPTARQWMSNLIRTLREATANNLALRGLRIHVDINIIELAPGYPVSRWRNDDRDDYRFFIRLLSNVAPWKDAVQEIENDFYLSEVWHQGEKTIGLRFAWASDALAVSLLSEPRWDCSHLLLKLEQLDDDEEFINEQIELVHASRPIHVKAHADWIKKRIRTGVHDGSDMWNRRDELFPHLEFCDRVREQMQELSSGDPILKKVKKQLFELEESSKNWTSGSKLDSLLGKPSTQGEGTRKQYKKEHTFSCPDGVDRMFSLHLRITESWRLHYSTELGPGKIIVGHIGPHLSTKKYHS